MNDALKAKLWSLPQPVAVFGSVFLIASAMTSGWMNAELLIFILLFLPIPLILIAERIVPRRKDWLLNWRDLGVDCFWLFSSYIIWVPIYSQYYDTPISNAFEALRNYSEFPFTLEADSMLGLVGAALIGILAVEFIGYWVHRGMHRSKLLWRTHATHHHITKMSTARADRTHPLEFLGLNLGSAVALAFLGASGEVAALVLIFRITNARFNHANLPLQPGAFGWIFATAQYHQLHHSCNFDESNTNYGCTVIIWDRLFGTFSDKRDIERAGNGTGERLSLLTQLALPFYSNKKIQQL